MKDVELNDSLEFMDPFHHLFILIVHQEGVLITPMPRVERVKAHHVKTLLRQCGLILHQDMIEILIVTPWHGHFAKATVLLVDAKASVVTGVIEVRIVCEALETVGKTWGRVTSDHKCVTNSWKLQKNY